MAVDSLLLAHLRQGDTGSVRLSASEYRELQQRPVLKPDEQIAPKSLALALTQAQARVESLSNEHHRCAGFIEGLQNTNQSLAEAMASAVQVHRDLLNLKGRMNNVAILIDRSSSMEEKDRWANTMDVVAVWLKHLAIKKCVLILFDDVVESVPQRGLVEMNDANREVLVNRVRSLKPRGNTATVAAFRTVYDQYSGSNPDAVDTIILFTDGKPYVPLAASDPGRDGFGHPTQICPVCRRPIKAGGGVDKFSRDDVSRKLMVEALDLVRRHPRIPINVVGLGDYFDPEQSQFLLDLKEATGGAFLGR